jgi:hypothetical protein
VPLSCAKAGVAQSKAKAAQIKVLASDIGAPPIRSSKLRNLANRELIRNPFTVSCGNAKVAESRRPWPNCRQRLKAGDPTTDLPIDQQPKEDLSSTLPKLCSFPKWHAVGCLLRPRCG